MTKKGRTARIKLTLWIFLLNTKHKKKLLFVPELVLISKNLKNNYHLNTDDLLWLPISLFICYFIDTNKNILIGLLKNF